MSEIYFIRCGEYVKIGNASDSQKRLSEIQVGNPKDVELVTTIKPSGCSIGELEKMLHRYYSSRHKRGEWFELNNREIAGWVLYDTVDSSKIENVVKSMSANESFEDKPPLTTQL